MRRGRAPMIDQPSARRARVAPVGHASIPREPYRHVADAALRAAHGHLVISTTIGALGTAHWAPAHGSTGEYIASTRVGGMLNVPAPFSRIV